MKKPSRTNFVIGGSPQDEGKVNQTPTSKPQPHDERDDDATKSPEVGSPRSNRAVTKDEVFVDDDDGADWSDE